MKATLPKVIVVLGPTASGKSDLAVELARTFNGEVVSADSRQVYTDLDIGTGKITKKEMKRVPHHLLDVVSAKKVFSVAEYNKLATKAITTILKKGKVPIICGGTGFYIQALVDGIILPEVPPNPSLRKELSDKSATELFAMLLKLDHQRAATIDPENPVRIIRAIEIATALGEVPPIASVPRYESLQVGIETDDELLKEKIKTRLLARIKKGMVREAINLHEKGISWKRMDELGLEYRYLAQYLQKEITKEEMIEKLSTEIWHYAKRQKTWFKRDQRIKWFKVTNTDAIKKEIIDFLINK